MDFTFAATPVLKQSRPSNGDGGKLFTKWLNTTDRCQPSPELLPKQRCTTANVDVIDQGDRYEGHTADLLFTKWLASTEAALSPNPNPTSGAVTPATVSRYAGASTPSGEFLALPGHPLSMLRSATDAACRPQEKIGSGWYASSPLLTRCDFGSWRDDDGSDDACSESDGGFGSHEGYDDGRDDAKADNGEAVTRSILPRLSDMQVSSGRSPQLSALTNQQDDMLVSPAPFSFEQRGPAPEHELPVADQVLALMVSPPPAAATGPGSQQGAAGAGVQGAALHLSWGSDASDSDSGSDVDLGPTFTPLSCAMSPVQELIGLMLTPMQPSQLEFAP